MKSLTEYLTFKTPHRRDYINITATVEDLVKKSGVREGLCLVNAMHITASVYINDDEGGLIQDFDEFLEKTAPYDVKKYRHHRTGEDNGDAHLKRQLFGRGIDHAHEEMRPRKVGEQRDFLRTDREASATPPGPCRRSTRASWPPRARFSSRARP